MQRKLVSYSLQRKRKEIYIKMYKFVAKLNKTDNIFMCGVYFLDLLIAVVYIFQIFQDNYFSGLSTFFIIYFSTFCGASIVIDFLLIGRSVLNKNDITKMHLLLVYIIVEISVILVNIIYYCTGVGDFWSDGYIFIILDMVMILMYLRRYCMLREFKNQVFSETEKTQ